MTDFRFDPERPVRSRQAMFAVIPTLLTLGNAVCGFGAITFAAMVGPELATAGASPVRTAGELLFTSAGLIFLAMVFDSLDGSVARMTRQTSDFGAQLDSLCDVISFGVAPAFLMLKLMHPDHKLMDTIARTPFEYPPRLLWAIAVMFMVCAILRLARFNVETGEKEPHAWFKGLPSPAAAGVIASFPISLQGLKDVAGETPEVSERSIGMAQNIPDNFLSPLTILLPVITVLVALLMVSRIRYPHFSNQFLRGKRSRTRLLKLLLGVFLVFVIREMALPVLFCYFAFAAPFRVGWLKFWAFVTKKKV